jgi:hypothetical protein
MRPSSRTSQLRFGFGGVAFELLVDATVSFALPPAYERHMVAPAHAPTLADVVCCVRLDRGLVPPPFEAEMQHGVLWEPGPECLHVRAHEISLAIRRTSSRHFAITAHIASSAALPRLLLLLATTVIELAGGASLHATAVEHEGRAVLLLGPSGAGKTTAAQLLGDVTCLANDRVNVVLSRQKDDAPALWVWALPGGSPPTLPRSAHVALPLSAMLRIKQAQVPRVSALRSAEAVLFVREAIEVSVNSEHHEAQRLAAASELAMTAASGMAHVALAQSWRADLEGFLADTARNAQRVHGEV